MSLDEALAEKLTALEGRVKLLEGQVKHQAASIDMLDSAVRVARHGQQEALEVNKKLLRAIRGAEVNLAPAPLAVASLAARHPDLEHDLTEIAQAVGLALDLLAAAQRDPL